METRSALNPVTVTMSSVQSAMAGINRTAGARTDLINHEQAAREISNMRDQLVALEAALASDKAQKRAEATRKRAEERAYERQITKYLQNNPREAARAKALGIDLDGVAERMAARKRPAKAEAAPAPVTTGFEYKDVIRLDTMRRTACK